MVPLMRRCAAVVAVLAAGLALPAAAPAQVDESAGCDSQTLFFKNGLCDGHRPNPAIAVTPPLPRAGQPVTFTADSYGRGLTYAWDLDDDGAYDDATGPVVKPTLGAGSHRVRVRATDEDGRTGLGDAHAAHPRRQPAPEGLVRHPAVLAARRATGQGERLRRRRRRRGRARGARPRR